MLTSAACYNKFGAPHASNPCMTLWDVPSNLQIGLIPKRIYCNKLMVQPLTLAFTKLITTGCVHEIKTWDGCFNIRNKRGLSTYSLHSWGLAVDINAFENGLNQPSKFSSQFVTCFTNAGFDWGGVWKRTDPMHYQLKSI